MAGSEATPAATSPTTSPTPSRSGSRPASSTGAARSGGDRSPDTAVFRLACTVQWGDCDPAGIIYYPTYYRWMDAATWAMFAQVGYPAPRIRAEQLSLPLVHADCTFERSPTFGDACTVQSQVVRWGGKSFTVAHAIVDAQGRGLAIGSETRVWCRYEDGPGTPLRGMPIGDDLKALFAA